jgi:small subunit ribosomal protein S8
MSLQDPIADLLTRMRNVIGQGKATVRVPYSGLKSRILETLKREGFIKDFETVDATESVSKELLVHLKYAESGASVINSLKRVSKPSCRIYSQVGDIKPVLNGIGINIISTPKGVLSDRECRKEHVGGEVICEVW